jgi:hypothetical protein
MSPISPILLNDAELIQAVVAPRVRLFPVLNRASAFAPLIIVCCVLPGLQLLAKPTLNEEGSLWGLRALAVANATTLAEILEPGLNEAGQPFLFQPPLAAWLNGAVMKLLGLTSVFSSSLASLVASAAAVWLTTRLAWRIGGAHTALISAFLMCCNPLTLEVAITPTNGAVSLCLMLASIFGFQRHLEGKCVRVSPSLIVSGVVWGLLVLAIGPVSLLFPVVFCLYAFNQQLGNHPEVANPACRNQVLQSRSVLRSTLFLLGLGLLISLWWGFVIGRSGFQSWWTNLPVDCLAEGSRGWKSDPRPLLQPTWQDWLEQQSLILPWLIVGLERSWHVCRRPASELIRRRHLLLTVWWCVAFAGRVLAEFVMLETAANTSVWNLALIGPTVLLASLGIGTLIERGVSRRGEFCLVVLIVSLTAARLAMSWLVGLSAGALVATFLIFGPILIPFVERTEHGWSQAGWRQLLQMTVYGSLIASLYLGLGIPTHASDDGDRLAELRDRFHSLPEVQRISLIAAQDEVPATLKYLLRTRWPSAQIVSTEGWDAGLTEAMTRESKAPQSRFLVLEWTYREVRILANTGLEWIHKPAGDPLRFHGHRLSMIMIEPRS